MTSAEAAHRKSGALARGWRDFRRWRRARPFWAGFFTILSGLIIFGSTQLTLSNFQIKIGLEGFLSYVIPLVLVLCGLLIWFTPQQRVFYGVIAAAVALYSFIGVNFGGFFFGMLFGIIGGSLAIAWTPVKPNAPDEESEDQSGGPADAERAPDEPGPYDQPEATVDELFTGPLTDVLPRPVNPLNQPAPGAHRYEEEGGYPRGVDDTQQIPAQRGDEVQPDEDQPREEEQPPRGRGNGTRPLPRRTPRLFVITLVPLLLTAVAFASLRGMAPARAAAPAPYPSPCPTATKSASAKPKPSSSTRSPAAEQSPEATGPAKSPSAAPSPSANPTPSPSPSESTEDPGLIGGVLDGIGDLLGIGEDATPSPSTTPSSAPPATPSAAASSGSASAKPESTPTSAKPTKSASASPKPASTADCVKVEAKTLAADGVPMVQKVPDQMLGTKLTLDGFSFDGVTELNTADGTIRVLQFSMTKAVTENFELKVPGPGKHKTSLKSSALTVEKAEGDAGQKVKFYCSRFQGKLNLVGVEIPIPLTFTPDLPPPLTLPEMVFTDIDIQLVFVDTDVLKAPNLNTEIVT